MKNMKIGIVGGGASEWWLPLQQKGWSRWVDHYIGEKPRVGKKILAIGNGRCNYTNIYADVKIIMEKILNLFSIFSKFGVPETMDFWETRDNPAIEEYSKVFPMSFQASSVLDVLRFELKK